MSRLMQITLSILLLATVAVEPAGARSRREKSEQSWENLRKLKVGEEIQVVYGDEQYLNGRFLRFTPEKISVQWGSVNRHEETISRKDVIRVIASRPSQRVKNALSGMGLGALVGLGVAMNIGHSESGAEVVFIPAGAAVIGAVAGALSSPDATIYEARRAGEPQLVSRVTPKARQTAKPRPVGSSSSGPLFGCPRCKDGERNRSGLH